MSIPFAGIASTRYRDQSRRAIHIFLQPTMRALAFQARSDFSRRTARLFRVSEIKIDEHAL